MTRLTPITRGEALSATLAPNTAELIERTNHGTDESTSRVRGNEPGTAPRDRSQGWRGGSCGQALLCQRSSPRGFGRPEGRGELARRGAEARGLISGWVWVAGAALAALLSIDLILRGY